MTLLVSRSSGTLTTTRLPGARDVDVDVGHRDLSCFPLDADDGHLHHTFRRTHLDIGPVHVVLRPAPGVDINVDVWRDGGC
jgi:hypothetical protein